MADDDYQPGVVTRALRGLFPDATGVDETFLAGLTGLASTPVQGLAGLAGGVNAWMQPESKEAPLDAFLSGYQRAAAPVQHQLTYEPESPEGRESLANVGKVMDLPHKAIEHAGSAMGLPPIAMLGGDLAADLLPGAAEEKAALAPKMLRRMAKERTAEVAAIPWDKLTPAEALDYAQAGGHLQPHPEGGFVGGPASAKTLGQVEALRSKAADVAETGMHGADWYARQHALLSELAPGKEHQLAKGIAVYSPQANPGTNLSWTAANWNKAIMDPEKSWLSLEGAPKTRQQAQTFLDTVLKGGEELPGGRKVGNFVNDLQEGLGAHPTNDLWTGRGLGLYGMDESRGLSEAEHGYASGETQLLAQELRDRGLDVSHPREAQAALWTGGRLGTELQGKEYGGLPFEQLSPELQAEALRRSSTGYDTEAPQRTAYMTRELVPSAVSGHLSGMVEAPFPERLQFTREAEPFQRDIPLHATGALNLKTGHGLGEFSPGEGLPTEYNPNLTSRMLASFEKGGGPGVENAAGRLLDTLATYHGATDVQAGVPYHMVKTTGIRPSQETAVRLQYTDPKSGEAFPIGNIRTRALYDEMNRRGLNLIDTGDGGFTVTSFEGKSAPEMRKALQGADFSIPGLRHEVTPGNYRGNYIDLSKEWGGPQGSGAVTKRLVEALRAEPGVTEGLQRAQPVEAARLHGLNAAEEAAMERGVSGAPRADVRKLRDVLREKGAKGLVQMTKGWKKADWTKAGLPVVAGMVFAGGASDGD